MLDLVLSVGEDGNPIPQTDFFSTSLEHPQDVLGYAEKCLSRDQDIALVVIVETVGGAVRAPGAMMCVTEKGQAAGYVSGGCIDADVIFNAQQALKSGVPCRLRYGVGSPFIDLPLPCGGAIEVQIFPRPARDTIVTLSSALRNRRSAHVQLMGDGRILIDPSNEERSESTGIDVCYQPKLKLRIAGRGADAIALSRLALCSGIQVRFQSPGEDELKEAARLGIQELDHLTSIRELPSPVDDPYTAFVLMFHDADWEAGLLKQALSSGAFYIGAVGSRKTHAKRCEILREQGCNESDISRIHGPIGLVSSLRNASALAVSAMAEILGEFKATVDSG